MARLTADHRGRLLRAWHAFDGLAGDTLWSAAHDGLSLITALTSFSLLTRSLVARQRQSEPDDLPLQRDAAMRQGRGDATPGPAGDKDFESTHPGDEPDAAGSPPQPKRW